MPTLFESTPNFLRITRLRSMKLSAHADLLMCQCLLRSGAHSRCCPWRCAVFDVEGSPPARPPQSGGTDRRSTTRPGFLREDVHSWRVCACCAQVRGAATPLRFGRLSCRTVLPALACSPVLGAHAFASCRDSQRKPRERQNRRGANATLRDVRSVRYLSSTVAPASSSFFLISSASSFEAPSFTALPPASTSSFASFRPSDGDRHGLP